MNSVSVRNIPKIGSK